MTQETIKYNVRVFNADGAIVREYTNLIDLRYIGQYLLMRKDEHNGELIVPAPGYIVEITTVEADNASYQ